MADAWRNTKLRKQAVPIIEESDPLPFVLDKNGDRKYLLYGLVQLVKIEGDWSGWSFRGEKCG